MRGIIIGAALALCSLSVQASEKQNYIGAAYVSGTFKVPEVEDFAVTGAHVQLGRELAPFFALEGRLGTGVSNVSDVSGVAVSTRVEYWASVFGRLYADLDRVRPYALLGYTTGRATAQASSGSVTVSVDDTAQDVSWGLGLELYGDESTAVMVEWVRYMDTDLYTVDAWAFGVSTHF